MGSLYTESRGFALIAVLLLLAALYAGATGIFIAARAELHAGLNHAAAERAFHAAEGGLATWLAAPLQPAVARYDVGDTGTVVEARPLLNVDSTTILYHIVARTERGDSTGTARRDEVGRTVALLGLGSGSGRIEPVPGTWRERF